MDEDEALDALTEMEDNADSICAYAGHDWADAGGGLRICTTCTEESWADD